jgi:hypothetical protein
VFAGGFTLADATTVAAAAVGGTHADIFDYVASLVDKSMLVRLESSGESRFSMPETIGEYGTERMNAAGEEPTTEQPTSPASWRSRREAEPHLRGSGQVASLDRLGRFWYVRGHVAEGAAGSRKPLEAIRGHRFGRTGPGSASRGDARQLPRRPGSRRSTRPETLALSRRLADERGVAGSLAALALAARSRSHYDESRRAYTESITAPRG